MEQHTTEANLVATLDAGHEHLSWDPGPLSGVLAGLDLEAIANSPEAAEIVPSLPVQPLYYALKRRGFEDSLDILPLMAQEQIERVLDYDAWSADRLVPVKLLRFMSLFGEISTEQLYERFSELDEEYQLATLQGRIRVYEVESRDDLSDEIQDRLRVMPCGKIFYEILTDSPEEMELIDKVIEAAKECNLRYAYSLIAHAAYIVPGEQEGVLTQFRKARLEEDGFISFEEAQELFAPFARDTVLRRWESSFADSSNSAALERRTSDQGMSFLDRVIAEAQVQQMNVDELFQIHLGFLYLANAMCAASHVQPDDLRGVHRLMEQAKSLVNLGLEDLAQSRVDVGVAILRKEAIRTLFQFGYSLVDELRREFISRLVSLNLPRAETLERYYQFRQWGKMQFELDRHWLEVIGLESSEILKGLFNRFPMYALETNEQAKRIVFRPISDARAFRELRLSVASILAYFACVVRTGLPLNQSFQIIVRETLKARLQEAAQDLSYDVQAGVQQILHAWRDRLRKDKAQWYVGAHQDLEAVLDTVIAMFFEESHGLVILPKARRSESGEEKEILQ